MTTTTETTMNELTRDDITALRKADSWTLHTNAHHGVTIRAYTRTYDPHNVFTRAQQLLYPTPHTDRERLRDVAATASITAYGPGLTGSGGWSWNSRTDAPGPGCFYSVYDTGVRHTIAQALRPGERLHIEWVADNNTDTIRGASLHCDQVKLHVCNGDGARIRTYLVGVQVSPDNSARMIRQRADF